MTHCLPDNELKRFRAGQLHDSVQLDRIAMHLANCPDCAERFQGVADEGEQRLSVSTSTPADSSKRSASAHRDPYETTIETTTPWIAARFDDHWPPPPQLEHHARWKVLDVLGVGGTGAVYLAEDRQAPGTFLALKILQPRLLGRHQFAARFRREVALMRAIPPHENLVFGLEAESLDPYQLLVMEYVAGVTFEELASSEPQQRLTFGPAVGLILQALAGLEHAWRTSGLVHRDLKPSNLMLTRDGTVKVLDFGLAKLQQGPDGSELTLTGMTGGTPKYCSPEQDRGLRHADIRSDLYSLGCTLFRLIAGEPVFGPRTGHVSDLEIRLAHQVLEPRSLKSLVPEVPTALDAVVQRLLAKEPHERPATPVEVARFLLPFATAEAQLRARQAFPALQLPASSPTPQGNERSDTTRRRGSLRARVGVSSLLTCLLVAALLSAWGIMLQVQTKAGQVEIAVDESEPRHEEPGAGSPAAFPWEIRIDDTPLDRTEIRVRQQGTRQWLTIDAQAGEHVVRVSRPGFAVVSQQVRVEAGRTAPISVRLIPTQSLRTSPPDQPLPGPTTAAREPAPPAAPGSSNRSDAGTPIRQPTARPASHRLATVVWGSGRWEREGDELCHYDGTGQGEQWLLFGDPTWHDYDFRFEVCHEGFPTGVTALFRSPVDEQIQHFGYGWLDLATSLVEYRAGNEFFLPLKGADGEYRKRQEEPIAADRWYRFQVEVRGEKAKCLVDEKPIFAISQNRYATGRVGVRLWRQWSGKTRFRNLHVVAPDGVELWSGPPDLPGPDPNRLVLDPPISR
jgi:serine/threonine protein kinase